MRAQWGLAWLLRDLIRMTLPPASLAPVAVALVTVNAMLVGFALPALLHLKNTPPARVLRRTMTAPPLRFGVVYAFAVGALFAILWSLVRDTELVVGVLAGVLGVGVVLAAAGYGLVRLTGRLRGGVGIAWRYGLANVSRRGTGSVLQIVAFGLGIMVLLLLAVVRGDLLTDWRRSLPSDVPNNFLVNIRPDERAPLEEFLSSHGFGQPALYPMVRARMTAIDGAPAESRKLEGDRARGFVEREQNLTWSAALPEDNQLIAGRWWTAAEFAEPLVSISSEYQEALGLKLGDTLSFDVAGESLTARVASIRKVRWDSFRPNFFLVFPPKLLDGAAGTYMTSIYLTAAASGRARRSGAQVPNDLRVRRGRHPEADPRDHGSSIARRAVRVPVHPGGGGGGAARRGAVDARRAPLRERDAAHAGSEPGHRAARRRRGVLRTRISFGNTRGVRRERRGMVAGAPAVLTGVQL